MNKIELVCRKQGRFFEFIRFCTVGAIATGIHYGVYYVCQLHINVNMAYTIGYFTSFVCNFFMTSYFTFQSTPSVKKAFGFGGSHLVNYMLHMGLFNLFLYLGISQEIAPLLVLAIVVPTNFILLQWVFRRKKKSVLDETKNSGE